MPRPRERRAARGPLPDWQTGLSSLPSILTLLEINESWDAVVGSGAEKPKEGRLMSEHDHQPTAEHAAAMFEPPSWDERYSGEEKLWSGHPNAQLVAEVSRLTAGTALDVGCGEGGDVIWLARQG